ncbi:membrane protease FtsH catalytic subunit [Modicisalibacter ilicicola DSM 19980]|uniref:ATP-dependent zinc metalloprotease FtsH n=1 Tax=Modicisalibacter ilicicola DSM 19980 TaxID=1121942 RepID=A0A1M4XIY2_9GAMM|nr:ATP-dependent zinc metalloprotease FtsH [Halomonas ilicicola]SHE93122.1 membrane protease FtsH catalytic subunit [Halomonas ilicicola DSM 19980]
MDRKAHINLWYVVLAIFALMLFQDWWSSSTQVEKIPYSEFESLLEDDRIEEIMIGPEAIRGTLKSPLESGNQHFETTRVDRDLAMDLAQYDVRFAGEIPSTFVRDLLSWIIPLVFFLAIWMFLIRRLAERQGTGGLMSVGKSKAKVYVEKDTKTTFDDVAGVDEAKHELQEIVSFLTSSERYKRVGARLPKGILLVGPPGTGKTLLARAVAGEAGVPFFSISGSEFVEMFVGVGAARVRDLFEQARKESPSIIFIDELDALGRARGVGPFSGGHDEKEQTLNQLLAELDGFDSSAGVVLLAATNRPEILDPALLRAGRFDRQVLVDRPDKIGRLAILKVHVRKIQLDPATDLEQVAALTPGFSGAELANLCNEAAILAARESRATVTLEDFSAAVERIVAGLEKRNRLLIPKERRTVAYHELGHALVALTLPGQDPVHKISIIPRGIGALGYTLQRPTEDRFLMTREELKNKMAVLLGGRAAEVLSCDEISTGASDDLMKATEIARAMVTRYGMVEALGQIAYETEQGTFLGQPIEGGGRRFSEETAREIDIAVKGLVEDAYEVAKGILERRRDELETLVDVLLEKETLTSDELPTRVSEPGVRVPERQDVS